MTLDGKTAVVTGASRGIGRAIALALADEGAKVAFCHHEDEEAAKDVLAVIEAKSQGVAMAADVSDEAAVVTLFNKTEAELGRPDILVNNAGILRCTPLVDTSVDEFDRIISVNLRGTFLACRTFVERSQSGRIINVASDLGLLGREEMISYTASKGGVIALTRTLARELAPNFLVNAIAPGSIETDMTSPSSMSPEQLARDMDTPLARFGQPEEIAEMAAFLAGPKASFITGQCIGVNGGSAMY